MHEITPMRLRQLIEYYAQARSIAGTIESELLHLLVKSENHGSQIDAIKVLGLCRRAEAELRGLKVP